MRRIAIGFFVVVAIIAVTTQGTRFAQYTNVAILTPVFVRELRPGNAGHHLSAYFILAFIASTLYHGCGVPGVRPVETYTLLAAGIGAALCAVARRAHADEGTGAASLVLFTGAALLAPLFWLATPDGCASGSPPIFSKLDAFASLTALVAVTLDAVMGSGGERHSAEHLFTGLALALVLYSDAGIVSFGHALFVLGGVGVLVIGVHAVLVTVLWGAEQRTAYFARYHGGLTLLGGVLVFALAAFLWAHFERNAATHGWWHVLAGGAAALIIWSTAARLRAPLL